MLKPLFAELSTRRGRDIPGTGIPSGTSSRTSWATATGPDGSSDEESFYDAPNNPASRARQESSERSINSSTADDVDDADTNWHKSPPPAGIFILPTGTSMEIESLIEPSIEALKKRHEEERLMRAERRQHVEPRFQVTPPDDKGKGLEHESGKQLGTHSATQPKSSGSYLAQDDSDTLHTSAHTNWSFFGIRHNKSKARLNGASDRTTASPDSGYGSSAADTSSIDIQPLKSSGIRGLFRRPKESAKKAESVSASSTIKECVSCFEDFEPKLVINVGCHDYCKECFQTLIDIAMGAEEHWPPKCCLNEITSDKIVRHLDAKKLKKYNDVVAERSVPAGDRIYCSKASCATWIPPNNVDKALSCASCPKCRQKSCTSCRGEYHFSGECPTDPALVATMQLAADEGWRRCYNCQAMVEHNQGCMHMTCKCKASFCYVCGKKWRTCSCGLEAPAAFLAGIEARRAATTAREQVAEQARAAERFAQEEADELLEMLREIEEFETMEAVQLASEEEAAQALREEKRIEAVMTRFQELNNELEFVHDVQRVALISQHEDQLLVLGRETKVWDATKRAHSNELMRAKTQAQARISEEQFWFDVEYQERLTKQRVIEDEYVRQLNAYWRDKEGGQVKIDEGRNLLKLSHATAYREWYELRKVDYNETIGRAQEALEVVKKRISTEAAAIDKERAAKEAELKLSAETNNRWMEMVAAERFNMLQNMEQAEYARVVES